MRQRNLEILSLAVVLIMLLSACASTGTAVGGGSAGDMAAVAAAPDYKEEVGDNGLPTVRAILARNVEAVGGEDAANAHTSFTAKGKFSLAAMGVDGDVTIQAAAPGQMKMVISTPMGDIQSGYNGEVAWSEDPFSGAQVLEGKAAAAAAAQANFFGPLAYGDFYTSMETLEEAEFQGETCYKVMLVDSEGGETTQYFSKESSLLIGQEAVADGPMGAADTTVVLSDYKEFGGVLVAGKTTINAGGMEIETTIDSLVYDNVDDSAFELSDTIKSLLE